MVHTTLNSVFNWCNLLREEVKEDATLQAGLTSPRVFQRKSCPSWAKCQTKTLLQVLFHFQLHLFQSLLLVFGESSLCICASFQSLLLILMSCECSGCF